MPSREASSGALFRNTDDLVSVDGDELQGLRTALFHPTLIPPALPREEPGAVTERSADTERSSEVIERLRPFAVPDSRSPSELPPPPTSRSPRSGAARSSILPDSSPSRPATLPPPTLPPPSIRFVSHGPFSSIVTSEGPVSRVVPAGNELVGRDTQTLSDYLFTLLGRLGVSTVFGVFGGAVAPLIAAVGRSQMTMVHTRHEAGAVFAAIESYFVKGKPSVVLTTTGPGLINALTGIAAARSDGAQVILLSGATAAPRRGRWAFQETSAYTMPISGLFTTGPLFHHAAVIEHPIELCESIRRIASGLQKPGGFVAHLSLPVSSQASSDFEPFSVGPVSMIPLRSSSVTAQECAQTLRNESFVIWAGFGARRASRQIRELARRTGAPVMCSPRAKGIFPESDPQYLGVTGFGGHDGVLDHMTQDRPAYVLVLGTRLGEFTSFWDPNMLPTKAFIHVDIDPEVPGSAYPDATTIGVQAEVGSFLDELLAQLPRRNTPRQSTLRPAAVAVPELPPEPRKTGPVRPDFLMAMIQQVIVDGSDAPIITEAGNAFAWGTHSLRFDQADRYRVSTGFGSMGHAVTGVLGMAIARRGKAFALAGDGAMLMNNEISTAVQYRIPAAWIVLNDSAYGMVEQGMGSVGMSPFATEIPHADFVMIARAMGGDGVRVEREEDVGPALRKALAAEGPFVVDVVIDATVQAPAGRRSQSIVAAQTPST
jgi:acetolactate synthase-1/2/3 large subunit